MNGGIVLWASHEAGPSGSTRLPAQGILRRLFLPRIIARTRRVLQPVDFDGAARRVNFHQSVWDFGSVVLGHSLGGEDKIDMAEEDDGDCNLNFQTLTNHNYICRGFYLFNFHC
jgi:hypothetical protein